MTGSGKTFTIANVIENVQKPTLVIAPNKTSGGATGAGIPDFFPKNAVEYFVSYYDYYQPEAYIASTDTYIEKEAQINDEIDRLRHAATAALLSRQDVIIVRFRVLHLRLGFAGILSRDYHWRLKVGEKIDRREIIKELIDMHYHPLGCVGRGRFRVTGRHIEIMSPAREIVTRIEIRR